MADRYYATPTQDEKSSVKHEFIKKVSDLFLIGAQFPLNL